MKFTDRAALSDARLTADGYLVANVRTARTGIQDYAGFEVGRPQQARVKVYRSADQVFARDSLASYAHKPITNDHPDEAVAAENWKDHAVGAIGNEVARDGEYVRIPLIVMDAKAIAEVQGGKKELSAGYTCDLAFEPGTTPGGETYDAIQKNIRINHVAIVRRGRAGSECRIGDEAGGYWGAVPLSDEGERPMADKPLKTVHVDGLSIEVTDQGAQVIEKLQKALADASAAGAKATTDHAAALAAKDEELGKLKVELKAARDAIPAADALDKLVADRAALVATARGLVKDFKPDGLSEADIRKAVVKAKLGDEMIADASDDQILGMFKAIAKDADSDPVRNALRDRATTTNNAKDNGQAAYEKRLRDAWKQPAKEAV